jgi:hypothetical protein
MTLRPSTVRSASSLAYESDRTLYDVLAGHAPAVSPRGETMGSRSKETVDRDAEAFNPLEFQRAAARG